MKKWLILNSLKKERKKKSYEYFFKNNVKIENI